MQAYVVIIHLLARPWQEPFRSPAGFDEKLPFAGGLKMAFWGFNVIFACDKVKNVSSFIFHFFFFSFWGMYVESVSVSSCECYRAKPLKYSIYQCCNELLYLILQFYLNNVASY